MLIVSWTLILYTGLFKKPEWIRDSLNKIFKIRMLKRWGKQVSELGDNLVVSSHAIGKKPFSFWISAFGATVFSWTSRFLVVNALLLAFSPVTGKQLLAFGRQFILWIAMTVSPTPGGSGFSEYMFSQYYADRNGIGYRVYMANHHLLPLFSHRCMCHSRMAEKKIIRLNHIIGIFKLTLNFGQRFKVRIIFLCHDF